MLCYRRPRNWCRSHTSVSADLSAVGVVRGHPGCTPGTELGRLPGGSASHLQGLFIAQLVLSPERCQLLSLSELVYPIEISRWSTGSPLRCWCLCHSGISGGLFLVRPLILASPRPTALWGWRPPSAWLPGGFCTLPSLPLGLFPPPLVFQSSLAVSCSLQP